MSEFCAVVETCRFWVWQTRQVRRAGWVPIPWPIGRPRRIRNIAWWPEALWIGLVRRKAMRRRYVYVGRPPGAG